MYKGRLRDRLHDRVLRRIAYRVMRADGNGERAIFTEGALCRELGVSRTVVREATKVLAAKGVLEMSTKIGVRARPRSSWNLTDPQILSWLCERMPDRNFIRSLAEIRQLLEPAAAGFAALRATPQDIALIHSRYERMKSAKRKASAFVAADLQFHTAVFAASHNELLAQIVSIIRQAMRASIKVSYKAPGLDSAIGMHLAVVEAISRRDGPGARAAMEELVARSAADITEVLKLRAEQPTESTQGGSHASAEATEGEH
jgi:GntR family transcriptional regulator, galactonate operon transcriptional repressor